MLEEQVNADFERARHKAFLRELRSILRREPNRLIAFHEVRSRKARAIAACKRCRLIRSSGVSIASEILTGRFYRGSGTRRSAGRALTGRTIKT